jgi:hypothetical protein
MRLPAADKVSVSLKGGTATAPKKGGVLMATEKFVCSGCGKEYDRETAVGECRMCHRTVCDECISEEGICVPCEEKEEK